MSIPVPWCGRKEISIDNVGNRTCDLPPFNAVPQRTAPRCNHFVFRNYSNFTMDTCRYIRNLILPTIPDFVVVWVKTLCANQKRSDVPVAFTYLPRITILIIKANDLHNFSNLFDKVLYMFRTGPLSINRSISTLCSRSRYYRYIQC